MLFPQRKIINIKEQEKIINIDNDEENVSK